MASRRQRSPATATASSRPQPPGPSSTRDPNLMPTTDAVGSPAAEALADLDLATRTMILKMQPKLREELLQALREEGPEGYRAFIRDYFRRLTQVKGAPR